MIKLTVDLNQVEDFVNSCLVKSKGINVSRKTVYKTYLNWYDKQDKDYPKLTQHKLTRLLNSYLKLHSYKSNKTWVYCNYTVREC